MSTTDRPCLCQCQRPCLRQYPFPCLGLRHVRVRVCACVMPCLGCLPRVCLCVHVCVSVHGGIHGSPYFLAPAERAGVDGGQPQHEAPQGAVAEGEAVVPGEARPAQARHRPPLPARHPAGCQASGVRCPGVQVAAMAAGAVSSGWEGVWRAAARGPLGPHTMSQAVLRSSCKGRYRPSTAAGDTMPDAGSPLTDFRGYMDVTIRW